MATVLDTSALVVLIRRARPAPLEAVAGVARGEMEAGATIPLPDLLIAATAVWLNVPLLTCDSDFRRGLEACGGSGDGAWSELRLHPASP